MTRIAPTALAAMLIGLAGAASAQQTPPVGPDFSKIELKTIDLGNAPTCWRATAATSPWRSATTASSWWNDQYAPMHDKLTAAIAAITPQPVRYVVNSHHHGDHTGGNAAFAKDGATIVAHENVRERLAAGTTHNLSGITTPPAAPGTLPAKTYADAMTLEVKGRNAQLKHPANAHTDGDTYVYFADANVLATGDAFGNGRYPNSDFLNGGNLRGMIAANDTFLTLINDDTKIVPGHGPLANKAQLAAFRDMLVVSRDRMAALIAEGKVASEAEAQAAKPFADLDAKWAANEQAAKNWVRVVYNSLKP